MHMGAGARPLIPGVLVENLLGPLLGAVEDTEVGKYFHSVCDPVWEVIPVQLGRDFASLPSYSICTSGTEYSRCSEKAECGMSRVVGKASWKR